MENIDELIIFNESSAEMFRNIAASFATISITRWNCYNIIANAYQNEADRLKIQKEYLNEIGSR